MVLSFNAAHKKRFRQGICVLLCITLFSACSPLGTQRTSNNSPIKPVIPASKPLPVESKPEHLTVPPTSHTESAAQNQPVLPPSSQQRLTPADVLSSIIDSAKKAINHQQWLRAQRHLEHALRINAKDAEVFYIYADVYKGLGIEEQAINMLKRAKFLAKPHSDIYRLASERLIELTE